MYTPDIYKNEDINEVKKFIKENGFAIIVNQVQEKTLATHVPLILDINENGEEILSGHLSKENPQFENLKNNDNVLVIFNGPHSYISSSWYQKENVPTWNYIAVHVYGKVKIIEGEELMTSLKKLVNKYEQHSKNPVSIEKMSCKTLSQINGIIGFTIKITEVQATYKLSQNRNEKDFKNIVSELEKTKSHNTIEVAKEMVNSRISQKN